MKDNWGDKVSVALDEDGESVYLSFPDGVNDAAFTAKKARKLAKKLRAAADVIDPRPEVEFIYEIVERPEPEPEFEVGDRVLVAEDAKWLMGSSINAWLLGNTVTVIEPVKEQHGYRYCWVGESADRGQFVNVECLTKVEPFVTLELNEDQAAMLAIVLSRVGGPFESWTEATSARVHSNEIADMLHEQGVDFRDYKHLDYFAVDERIGGTNSIYFKPVAK